MDYLICQDWKNTSGNHAGIKHLCNELVRKYPDKYTTYCRPFARINSSKNILHKVIVKIHCLLYELVIGVTLLLKLKTHDRVFLMEYLGKGLSSQLNIARILKLRHTRVRVYGMAHFVPSVYDAAISTKEFIHWDKNIYKFMTLGHSLSNYLISIRNVKPERVITTFHYVDTAYYYSDNHDVHTPVTVIVMGNMQRNYSLLKQVVQDNPNTLFLICQGIHNLSCHFDKQNNVKLIPFVTEQELYNLMKQADISLNMMNDTIGSNVIVTSMAMGLAMICSNVGSIGDYCSDSNSILCDNHHPEEFTVAIKTLSNDRSLLKSMKEASHKMALEFSIERFHNNLQSLT